MQAISQPIICNEAPKKLNFAIPYLGTYFPKPEAAKAPVIPHSPSIPTISLPAQNGFPAIWKAMQDHIESIEPKASPPRRLFKRIRGCVRKIDMLQR